MATKDEYYLRIIASLQSEITSLKTGQSEAMNEIKALKSAVARQQKEIEALKASQTSQPTPSYKGISTADKTHILQQAKKESEILIKTRFDMLSTCYADKGEFDAFRRNTDNKYLAVETFTTYQKAQETRLTTIEKKQNRTISLLTINRHTQKGDHKTNTYFDLDTFISRLKKISPQWLISVLVFLALCMMAVFVLRSIRA